MDVELSAYQYVIAILGGFVAGGINSLAGYGSVITLSILIDVIGLPGNIANGTNRLNVFTGTAASGVGFYKNGKLDFTKGTSVILVTFIGAIFGIILAINVSNAQFKEIFKYLIVLLFLSILIKPARWLREENGAYGMPLWQTLLIYLPLGFYGGFIQMGMGLFFVAVTVIFAKYTMIESNALKVLVICLYTALSIIVFHFNGMVDWKIGLMIGGGAAVGGYATAHMASVIKNANLWAYRLLMVIVVVVILRTFGLFDLIINLF